ncbi:MAG: hypothetical protein H0V25_04290 [Solirubrobacterales bacterium]|nr:hypothetical protein [Solirubrobacterales bacterium]
MSAPRSAGIACASAALALVLLGGCGEKEEPATTGPVAQTTTGQTTTINDDAGVDRQLVTHAATAFLNSPVAETVCDSRTTPEFLQREYGGRAGCLAARKPGGAAEPAKVAKVGQVGVDSGSATVVARAAGGSYGAGQTLTMSIVRDGSGTWRIARIQSSASAKP